MGVPALLVEVAANQRAGIRELVDRGIARALGKASELDPATVRAQTALVLADASARAVMAERGRLLVDGRGTDRVIAAMESRAARARTKTIEEEPC
jgi:spore coat polysaccharide biosynthesis predicted glycosyltransferase SpsG